MVADTEYDGPDSRTTTEATTLTEQAADRTTPSAEKVSEVLLASARRAGRGFVHVRGVDLVAAITGTIPEDWEPAT